MSEPTDSDGAVPADAGVLASLPRTRPQRPSRRRVSASAGEQQSGPLRSPLGAASEPTESGETPPAKRPSASRRKTSSAARTKVAGAKAPRAKQPAGEPPVPAQGYEPESEAATGSPVTAPTGPELLASLAEVAGELFQASLSTGGRLLKDALSRR